jgi:hypothetical protein
MKIVYIDVDENCPPKIDGPSLMNKRKNPIAIAVYADPVIFLLENNPPQSDSVRIR